MAQPLSSEFTYCSLLPLLEKDIRGRKKTECTEKEDRERRLLPTYTAAPILFFRKAPPLNLSEFKFNEKYSPVRSEKSVASCRDGCFGNR